MSDEHEMFLPGTESYRTFMATAAASIAERVKGMDLSKTPGLQQALVDLHEIGTDDDVASGHRNLSPMQFSGVPKPVVRDQGRKRKKKGAQF